jgi:hydroxyacylglutathione hydrolase
MHVHGLRALSDNYIWLIQHAHQAWVIDPGAAEPVVRFLSERGLTLSGILLTHHHADHTAGVEQLLAHTPNIAVYGNPLTAHPAINKPVEHGHTLQLGPWTLYAIATPGHTLDHLCFVGEGALFSGDTLFTGGCGRLFEGTAQQMATSLLTLRELDDDLAVYCGHEYTLSNLNFALRAEPNNAALRTRYQHTVNAYQHQQACAPSTLGLEKQTNPFLRFDLNELTPQIIDYGRLNEKETDAACLFGTLRAWKDTLDQTGELDAIYPIE